MRHKSLWKISVTTTPESEDAVTELLSATFKLPASAYTDCETGVCTVTVYLQQKPNLSREDRKVILTGLKRIKQYGLRIGSRKLALVKVRQEDWAESWKRHFKPIEIGDALLIKPSWSRREPRKNQAVMVLDPGLSFGTGQHPTTAFCLHQIVQFLERKNERSNEPHGLASRPYHKPPAFLDLGTGSGILAIAAAKLGYSPVRGIDLDLEAVRLARANARINNVLPKVKIRRSNVSKLPIRPRRLRHGYDLVCANLISDLLIAERRRIAGQLNRMGTLVLAGILRPEFREVQKAYKTLGLRLISRRNDQEWCSGSFRFGP